VAAGKGTRLHPLTATTPKPLIEVRGKRMIEGIVESIISHGITEIYVVVGYMREKFEYLPAKYAQASIVLLHNPDYDVCNNISSLYAAREHLGNCIITDGDLVIRNSDILNPCFSASGYCSAWAESTGEWLQTVDDDGYVLQCSRTGGTNGWQLYSVSFWTEKDGAKLRHHIEEAYKGQGMTDIFWDDVPMFLYRHEYRLQVRPISHADIMEIDTLSDLEKSESR